MPFYQLKRQPIKEIVLKEKTESKTLKDPPLSPLCDPAQVIASSWASVSLSGRRRWQSYGNPRTCRPREQGMLMHMAPTPTDRDLNCSSGQTCCPTLTVLCLSCLGCKMGLVCVKHSERNLWIQLAAIITTISTIIVIIITLPIWKWVSWCLEHNRCSKNASPFPPPPAPPFRELFQSVSGMLGASDSLTSGERFRVIQHPFTSDSKAATGLRLNSFLAKKKQSKEKADSLLLEVSHC